MVNVETGVLKTRAESLLVPKGKDVTVRGDLAGAEVARERVVANPRQADRDCLVPELDSTFRRFDGAEG